jgi:signal transduction histidine kinase
MGLVGMGERVTAAGGRLEAGPVGPGWLVHANVPVPAGDRS